MENKTINSEVSKSALPAGLLKALVYIAGCAQVIALLPYFNTDSIDFFESISPIGEIVSTLIEALFLCLVAYKVNKEDMPIPAKYILAFAAIGLLTMFQPLFSDGFEIIMSIIVLIVAAVVVFNFIKFKPTQKIGLFQIATIACSFLLTIYSDELLSVSDIGILKILIFASVAPFVLYLGSCYDFLCEKSEE